MKSIHLRKLLAVMEVKGKTLLDKTYIIMPLFSIGFALLMRFMSSVYMEMCIRDRLYRWKILTCPVTVIMAGHHIY